ncbi:MAG: flagellar motor protein MotB [Methylocystis sp.]|jgi:chemotaxis protein MotB
MSSKDANEIIIVKKRRWDADEEHHGGVWKLAFADFMTAMMAFFLVMWLINSTSQESKAAIVQYFNPVQLVDSKPAKKGLRDPRDSGQGASMQQTIDKKEGRPGEQNPEAAEAEAAALHKNPVKALDAIAKLDVPPAATPRSSSNMLADPFERMEQAAAPEDEKEVKPSKSVGQKKSEPAASNQPPQPSPSGSSKNEPNSTIKNAIEAAVRAEGQGARGVPKFEVKRVDEGVLVSLTDDANFSMFDVGSIRPKPQLVRILQKIGGLLAKLPGDVEIAGHTDARAYKSGSYDNWRLSSDRANMVLYMLGRGGLPAARVTKISGYADRRLKTPETPLAAVNRRIEILVRGERS